MGKLGKIEVPLEVKLDVIRDMKIALVEALLKLEDNKAINRDLRDIKRHYITAVTQRNEVGDD